MARLNLKWTGFDEYIKFLEAIGVNSERVAASALGQGARVTADEVRKRIEAIPAVSDAENKRAFHDDGVKYRMSVAQKAGLLHGLGIARFNRTASDVNTSIGFDGYNDVKTKKYPNGQPNQLVARIYERGTEYSEKQPFVRQAKNASKKKAEAAMIEAVDRYIESVKRDKGI